MPPAVTFEIGTKFYEHKGADPCTVSIHVKRVQSVNYRNKVNIYRVEKGKDLSTAKLVMFGITIRTSQGLFNLGEIVVKPGDCLYAYAEKRGLGFDAIPNNHYLHQFKALFE